MSEFSMQHAELDLADSLTRCARGERAALQAIFAAEGGRLIAVAQRVVRRRELAEEVVQDAFVQIWTKAHQYAPERGSARGWIYAIVRNRAINLTRDMRREDTTDPEALAALSDAGQEDPAQVAWSELDLRSRLRTCLEGLDEVKRRSILMAYVSGYSHGEIAGRLKAPLGTTKAWIRRGLNTLRDCMA